MHDSLINEQEKAIQKWTLRNVKSAIPSPPVISASAFSDILMPSGLSVEHLPVSSFVLKA